jgi:hypothetical protein
LYLGLAFNPTIGELGSDAAEYMMMAASHSPFVKTSVVVVQAAAVSRFPPVYPLALGMLGAAENLELAHIVTAAFLLCALAMYYAWLRNERLGAAASALLMLLAAVLPGTFILNTLINSEFLYLMISMLALLSMKSAVRSGEMAPLYTAAIAVAVAALTRTIGVTLFAPLLLCAIRIRKPAGAIAVLVAALPLLEWHQLHRAAYGYFSNLAIMYGHSLTGFAQQLSSEPLALRDGFAENFTLAPGAKPIAYALAAVCIPAAALRAAMLRMDAVYALAFGTVLLIWPYPEVASRLVWPVLPVVLAQPVLLVRRSDKNNRRPDAGVRTAVVGAVAASVLLMALPAIAFISGRYRDARFSELPDAQGYEGWYATDLAHATFRLKSQIAYMQSLHRMRDEVPENDCVLATRPDLIRYLADRRSVFPPLNSTPDPYFSAQMQATGCHFVFMTTTYDPRYPIQLFPEERLPKPIHVLDYSDEQAPAPASGHMICILAELG